MSYSHLNFDFFLYILLSSYPENDVILLWLWKLHFISALITIDYWHRLLPLFHNSDHRILTLGRRWKFLGQERRRIPPKALQDVYFHILRNKQNICITRVYTRRDIREIHCVFDYTCVYQKVTLCNFKIKSTWSCGLSKHWVNMTTLHW